MKTTDLLPPGHGGVPGLIANPRTVRARLRVCGPEDSLHTEYDLWTALDFYFSELRDQYLAGTVKLVINMVSTRMSSVVASSYSIVPTPAAQVAAMKAEHLARIRQELEAQYKNAMVRAVAKSRGGDHPKRLKRMRHRLNQHFGDTSPPFDEVDAYFEQYPEAIEAVSGIRKLWDTLPRG